MLRAHHQRVCRSKNRQWRLVMGIPSSVVMVVTFGLFLIGLAGSADAQLYDDFNAAKLNPDKWVGEQTGDPVGLRLIRTIEFDGVDGHLVLTHRAAGSTSIDTGSQVSRNRLVFTQNPNAITAMKFDVSIRDFSLAGCSVPASSPSSVRAGTVAFFFNDGSSTGPQDDTGDIGAVLELSRASNSSDPASVLRALGILIRCQDAACPLAATLAVVDLGPVQLGNIATLFLRWDRVGKKIDFQRNAEAVTSIPYTQDDSRPPVNHFKTLEVRAQVANCTVSPRPISDVTGVFDNVFINAAAVPTPTNGPPVANPQVVTTNQGVPVAITLSGTDEETATTNLTYTVTSGPANGALTGSGQGLTYTPNPTFAGADSFQFTVTDRGAPDNCGTPGPRCASPLTSTPATMTIVVRSGPSAPSARALATPLILVPPSSAPASGPQPLGNIQISEGGVGTFTTAGRIELQLPAGLTFAAPPSVSTIVSGGSPGLQLVLTGPDAPRVEPGGGRFSFAIATPSSTGPATLLISGISVSVPPGFPTGPVLVGAAGPAFTPGPVQNATAVPTQSTPTLTDVSLSGAGQGATTQTVVLTGVNFAAGDTISFGAGVTVTSLAVDSPTQITATVTVDPGAAVGPRDVTVNFGAQSSTVTGQFKVTSAPTVTSTDRQGDTPLIRNVRAQPMSITGTNFEPPTTSPPNIGVSFSGTGITVGDIGYLNPTTLSLVVDVATDADLTPRTVTVTNADGGTGTSAAAVVQIANPPADAPVGLGNASPTTNFPPPQPIPVIATLDPPTGLAGITAVTIGGANFDPSSSVTFAGQGGTRVPAPVTAASPGSLTVTVPANAIDGPVRVAVNGQASSDAAFTVTNPRLSAVIPENPPAPGSSVTLDLTGTKFAPGVTVTFSGAPTDFTIVGTPTPSPDGTLLPVGVTVAGDAQPGPRDVTVTNADGGTSTLAAAFQVGPPLVAGFEVSVQDPGDPAVNSVTYLPTVDGVLVTLDTTGRCIAKTVTPHAVTLRARFITGPDGVATPPDRVTFTLISSALPGTATNEDCELGAIPANDFSVGVADVTAQQIADVPGTGVYETTLYSYDWGGTVQIAVTGTASVGGVPTAVTSNATFPLDTDGDGLPDAYETDGALNANAAGANVLDRLNPDQDGNGIPDGQDRFAPDGLGNFAKYRGVYLIGPAPGGSGPMANLTRLGAGMRHLFVRGRGFGNDPLIQARPGTCGIAPTTGVPVADPTLSDSNPCPPFEVGDAFKAEGVKVHDVTGSFSGGTVFPRRSLTTPALAQLDLVTVDYDAINCAGGRQCSHTTKFGVRQWEFPTMGFSAFGGPIAYSTFTRVFKKAVDGYFQDKPYQHRESTPDSFVLAPDGRPLLAPITLVGDGNDNGLVDNGEQTTASGDLVGDTYIPGSFAQQLSAMNVANDSCVELPFVADPSLVADRCSPPASVAVSPKATKRQVVRSVITHELGHAVGINYHTPDTTDLMYQFSINWTRDGHFSSDAARLIQIHNGGLQ
jgi:hypothetical protein